MKLRFWIVASGATHALLLLGLWPVVRAVVKPLPPKSTSIEFELKTASAVTQPGIKPAGSETPGRNSHAKTFKDHSAKTQKLQALLNTPFNSAQPSADGAGSTSSSPLRSGRWDEGGYTTKDDSTVAWGAGSGTFERVQDLVLMSKLQEKIDALLFYPGVLARHKISGTVNSRLVLIESGDCDWQRTQIQAADPHLRIYILHLLKKLCSENFKKYTHARELTNVDLSFKFEISEDVTSKELLDKNQLVIGNVLVFYRQSRDSIAEWHLGPFQGMFPIPFVSVNFDWLQENFETYLHHKDLLKEFRSDSEPP